MTEVREVRARRLAAAALVLALALVAHAPHIVFGRADTNLDFQAHYRWSIEIARAIAAGDPYPRWTPLAWRGLGQPALLYYAPLYYLLTGLVRPLTANIWQAMHVVELVSTLAGAWFTWRLVRAFADERAALLGAALAALNPLAIMIFQGFNGFPWGAAFGPMAALFWAVLRPEQPRVNVAAMVALALVICTHTVSGLMAMVALSPLAFVGADGRVRFDAARTAMVALVFAGGLALSAAYLLPALASRPLVDFGVLSHKFTPWAAFVFPAFTAPRFGMRWFALQVPLPAIAFGGAAIAAAILARVDRTPARRWLGACALAAGGVALFFALEVSYPVWRIDGPLRMVQFPFRWTMIPAVLFPMLAPLALAAARGWPRSVMRAAVAANVLVALALVARLSTSGAHPALAVDRVQPYIGLPEYRIAPLTLSTPYVAGGMLPGECARLRLACTALSQAGAEYSWRIAASAPARVRLPVFDFPAFAAVVDGRDVPHTRDAATGTIAVDLAPGSHLVRVGWRRLPVERLGFAVTTVAFVAALALSFLPARRRMPA